MTAPRPLLARLRSPVARQLPWALVTALAVECGLRVTSLPTLVRLLGLSLHTTTAHTEPRSSSTVLGTQDAARYRAARRVLRLWPRGGSESCLRLALTAGFLLRHRHPRLHLGVAQFEGGTRAHAWISIDGVVFDPIAACYRPLTEPEG